MSIDFTVDDAFEMAGRIESDAAAFYKRAGAAAGDPVSRQVLLDLAAMEAEHEHVFASLKARLPGGSKPRPADARKWPGVAQTLACGVNEDLAERFTGTQTNDQILQKAIGFEKDSIVYFLSLRNLLEDPADRQRIDRLLTEEIGHILALTGRLTSSG